jgi:putative two-component system response regulator
LEKILLVDDDEMSLMVTEMVLTEMKYEVKSVMCGKDCIESLKSDNYDLLLLDVELGDTNGIRLLEQIREDPDIKDTRTVFLTVSSQREDLSEAVRLGALDFIRKPALPEQLLRSVRDALSIRKKETILAVDDEPMNLMATEEIFGIRYNVRTAGSGEEALAEIEKERPDLVLLDLHMPGMDGLEVMAHIRDIEGGENLPVIFLTADDDADTEAEIFKAGAMDFIRKPFVMQVALQRIRHVLQLKQLQDSMQEEVDRKTEAITENNRKIRNLSRQVIMALAGTIDAKDTYTNGHSNRVAEYAHEIAVRMGKSEQEKLEIYSIALLHDVGKIGIPLSIINKPGKLTDEEFEEIKSHTVRGYDILKTISEMPELSTGARWHHERYDGKGYPDRKSGEDIPEVARIICVADCYDAMSSDRSYRKALPQDVVRSEIENNKGTQFDPKIADIMLQMIDEDKDYQMRGDTDGR